eukprot:XP_014770821.1 PREDICTED: keratin, type I cytoskeletal 9-like [Octopus bimaculoides]
MGSGGSGRDGSRGSSGRCGSGGSGRSNGSSGNGDSGGCDDRSGSNSAGDDCDGVGGDEQIGIGYVVSGSIAAAATTVAAAVVLSSAKLSLRSKREMLRNKNIGDPLPTFEISRTAKQEEKRKCRKNLDRNDQEGTFHLEPPVPLVEEISEQELDSSVISESINNNKKQTKTTIHDLEGWP